MAHARVGWMRGARPRLAIAFLLLGSPPLALAQEEVDSDLLAACAAAGLTPDLQPLCHDVAVAIELFGPEAGMAIAGGNPVLGTASPIGARFRAIPRMQLGGRINLGFADLPDVIDYPDGPGAAIGRRGFVLPSPQLDLSVGLFKGFTMANTLSGLLAVELLGSLGTLILPAGEGFENDANVYGVGARIGLLRESFTTPGISVTGVYKWAGRVRYGNLSEGDDARFGMDLQVASIRAGLGKSVSSLALTLTLGYDRYGSDVDFAVASPSGASVPVVAEGRALDFDSERWSAFIDVAYVVLYFSLVAEIGWQEAQTLPLSNGQQIESGNLLVAMGLRLSI